MMRKLIVLGATGSIGTQALDVARNYPQYSEIVGLSAHNNAEKLFKLVREFRPKAAALSAKELPIPADLRFCNWYFGEDALENLVKDTVSDDVLISVVGMSSLRAVAETLKSGRRVLLANKETLVAGGHIIMPMCRCFGEAPNLIPVDSEHSAIFQCLQGSQGNPFSSLLLTASGGPFRDWNKESIANASVEQALKHPNWSMGAKISIDSASMFNKALEIIEARWLFDASPDKIKVLIHPQSIVHSLVEFLDGSVLAQLGVPDMKTPIMYAMHYPVRLPALCKRLSLQNIHSLSFFEVDTERFPALDMAYQALHSDEYLACVLNAANEIAVENFLNKKISFGHIYRVVLEMMNRACGYNFSTVDDILYVDRITRIKTKEYIESMS